MTPILSPATSTLARGATPHGWLHAMLRRPALALRNRLREWRATMATDAALAALDDAQRADIGASARSQAPTEVDGATMRRLMALR
jgi:uncharacterized protein YjiS (DUF1127 family)